MLGAVGEGGEPGGGRKGRRRGRRGAGWVSLHVFGVCDRTVNVERQFLLQCYPGFNLLMIKLYYSIVLLKIQFTDVATCRFIRCT